MGAHLTGLITGDDPAAWRRLGFAVGGDGVCRLGDVAVRLDGGGGGLRSWLLRGDSGPAEIDGLQTRWSPDPPGEPAAHPNGATTIDHVVVFTDSRDRTVDALTAAGGDERRRAGPPAVPVEMAFVRLGTTIVEVATAPDGPTRFWGLVAIVPDVDALAAELGDLLGAPRDAVQRGRRIVTARAAPGLEVALAFMTPRA